MTKKFAIIVGINYTGQKNMELYGCINDAVMMKDMLVSHLGYDTDEIIMMTDESASNKHIPTYKNIIYALEELRNKAQSGKYSEIWFHYSGHGYMRYDRSGDEKDHYDEIIIPLDFAYDRLYISDDQIHNIFTSKISEMCKATVTFDCCHSGTMLDLKYRYILLKNTDGGDTEDEYDAMFEVENPKTYNNNIISISGCKDDQTSSEAYIYRNESINGITKQHGGATTIALCYALTRAKFNITCKGLLEDMRKIMSQWGFSQIPQICTSKILDEQSMFCQVVQDPDAFVKIMP